MSVMMATKRIVNINSNLVMLSEIMSLVMFLFVHVPVNTLLL